MESVMAVAGAGLTPRAWAWAMLHLTTALSQIWVLICACLVFFMQAGFGMLEAGSVQEKNTRSILFKNLLDVSICGVAYMMCGYFLAFGTGGNLATAFPPVADLATFTSTFSNNSTDALRFSYLVSPHNTSASAGLQFAGWSSDMPFAMFSNPPRLGYAHAFYMFGFAATCATIVSGAVAERANIVTYLWLSFVLGLFVQPIAAHWLWSSVGWLSAYNDSSMGGLFGIDFAGSGVVHVIGGVAAFQAARAVGPRLKPPRFGKDGKVRPISPSNASLTVLGALILWFCWFGFNAGGAMLLEPAQLFRGSSSPQCLEFLSPHMVNWTLGQPFPEAMPGNWTGQGWAEWALCSLVHSSIQALKFPVAARAIINTLLAPLMSCGTAALVGYGLTAVKGWKFRRRSASLQSLNLGQPTNSMKKESAVEMKEPKKKGSKKSRKGRGESTGPAKEKLARDNTQQSKDDTPHENKSPSKTKRVEETVEAGVAVEMSSASLPRPSGDSVPTRPPPQLLQRIIVTIVEIISCGRFDLATLVNGILIGLVAITAPCATISPGAAALTGVVAGVVYVIGDGLLIQIRVDDPLNASVVHAMGGVVGLLAAAFSREDFVRQAFDRQFPGIGMQLLIQLGTAGLLVLWAGTWAYLLFGLLVYLPTPNRLTHPSVIRLSLELEELGGDVQLNWGIGKVKLRRTLAQYLTQVHAEEGQTSSGGGGGMSTDLLLALPTTKAILRYVVDRHKPHYENHQEQHGEDTEGGDRAENSPRLSQAARVPRVAASALNLTSSSDSAVRKIRPIVGRTGAKASATTVEPSQPNNGGGDSLASSVDFSYG